MKQAEKRINNIEDMASLNEPDNRIAEVAAICELARAVHRLGDLYLTDLILHGALGDEISRSGPGSTAARAAKIVLQRMIYSDENDARSE